MKTQPRLTQDQLFTYWNLHKEWTEALEEKEADVYGTDDYADGKEQRAYDALVDFIEAENLNYSSYDVRGQR